MAIRSFTGTQYLALGIDAPYTGDFALENRGPLDQGGSGNYYASRGTKILGIVVHISAGLQDVIDDGVDHSAEGLAQWGSTTLAQASWPVCSDTNTIVNCLHPDRVAWLHGVPGYNFNRPLWGQEICKLHANWDTMPDWWVRATLKMAAIAAAPIVKKYGIPLRVLTNRDEIQRLINAGMVVGFTEHWRLTPETRSDAGRVGNVTTFPWDIYFDYIRWALSVMDGGSAVEPDDGWPKGWIADRQRFLNTIGITDDDGRPLDVDDSLGPKTESAVRAYQAFVGITVDGKPGDATKSTEVPTMTTLQQLAESNARIEKKLDSLPARVWSHQIPFSLKTSLGRVFGKSSRAGAVVGYAGALGYSGADADKAEILAEIKAGREGTDPIEGA